MNCVVLVNTAYFSRFVPKGGRTCPHSAHILQYSESALLRRWLAKRWVTLKNNSPAKTSHLMGFCLNLMQARRQPIILVKFTRRLIKKRWFKKNNNKKVQSLVVLTKREKKKFTIRFKQNKQKKNSLKQQERLKIYKMKMKRCGTCKLENQLVCRQLNPSKVHVVMMNVEVKKGE